MKKKLRLVFLFIFLAVLINCVSSRIAKYPGFNYPPTNPDKIQIFNLPPTVPFEIIGEVEGEGGKLFSYKIALSNMRKKAASIGGDAIVLISRREKYLGTYTTPSKANAFIYGNYIYYTYTPGTSVQLTRKHFLGVVIRWENRQ